jgi:dTMP kinase
MTGRFITLEGGEGAGKSTQIRHLARFLESQNIEVVTTREPGGSPGAEAIRALLVEGSADRWDAETECLLHFAARRDHLRQTVWPALETGAWVISDRFADSTTAYQGYAQGLGFEFVNRLYRQIVGAFKPDLTLILDLPSDIGLARAAQRGGAERYESMGPAFHEKLRQGFLEIARKDPERCWVIAADRPEEEVAASIEQIVSDRLLK